MFFPKFDSDVVNSWIEECAANAADSEMYDEDTPLDERVANEAEKYVCYSTNAIKIVAHYGVLDYMNGCDWEDSPQKRFEDDIYFRAEELMAEE